MLSSRHTTSWIHQGINRVTIDAVVIFRGSARCHYNILLSRHTTTFYLGNSMVTIDAEVTLHLLVQLENHGNCGSRRSETENCAVNMQTIFIKSKIIGSN